MTLLYPTGEEQDFYHSYLHGRKGVISQKAGLMSHLAAEGVRVVSYQEQISPWRLDIEPNSLPNTITKKRLFSLDRFESIALKVVRSGENPEDLIPFLEKLFRNKYFAINIVDRFGFDPFEVARVLHDDLASQQGYPQMSEKDFLSQFSNSLGRGVEDGRIQMVDRQGRRLIGGGFEAYFEAESLSSNIALRIIRILMTRWKPLIGRKISYYEDGCVPARFEGVVTQWSHEYIAHLRQAGCIPSYIQAISCPRSIEGEKEGYTKKLYLSENWWVSLDKIAPEHERMRDFLEKLAKIIKQDLDQYGIVADDLESVRNIFANEPFLCELRDYLTTVGGEIDETVIRDFCPCEPAEVIINVDPGKWVLDAERMRAMMHG